MSRIIVATALALFLTAALAAQEPEPLDEASHLAVMALREAGPPRVLGNAILFSSSFTARFVGLAFEHENWRTIHSLRRNQHGVFFLLWPVPPLMSKVLAYRYQVDGAWCPDPLNPARRIDPASGLQLSLVQPPTLSDERPGIFRVIAPDGRTARFRFRGQAGQVVTVTGSFNAWDPFMYELEETSPGVYSLDLPLPSGEQRYAFIYLGSYHHDVLNPDSAWSPSGVRVSRVVVPGDPDDERMDEPAGISLLP